MSHLTKLPTLEPFKVAEGMGVSDWSDQSQEFEAPSNP